MIDNTISEYVLSLTPNYVKSTILAYMDHCSMQYVLLQLKSNAPCIWFGGDVHIVEWVRKLLQHLLFSIPTEEGECFNSIDVGGTIRSGLFFFTYLVPPQLAHKVVFFVSDFQINNRPIPIPQPLGIPIHLAIQMFMFPKNNPCFFR